MIRIAFPLAVVLLAAPAAAQGLDGARVDLSFGLLSGDASGIGTGEARADAAWAFGAFGLQAGAEFSGLGFAEGTPVDTLAVEAVHLILWRDVSARLRLGASATLLGGDTPGADTPAIGLHGRYDGIGFTIEGDIVKPLDDDASNGTIIGSLRIAQELTDDLTLRTELFRQSTDSEEQDRWAILLGADYTLDPRTTLFADAFHSGADDAAFTSTGLHLGLARSFGPGHEVFAAITIKDGTAITAEGVTLGLRFDWDGDRLFSPGALPSLAGFGLY